MFNSFRLSAKRAPARKRAKRLALLIVALSLIALVPSTQVFGSAGILKNSEGIKNAPDATCPAGGQCFADVLSDSAFYEFVNRIYIQDLVTGYSCGGAGEPCDAQNRPYYRPGATVTRQQMAKFIDQARRLPQLYINSSSNTALIYARNEGLSYGIQGESTADGTPGVYGSAGEGIGVRGSSATGTGVYATSGSSYGIYAVSTSGDAGYFGGDVEVVGDMTVIGNCCAAGAATSRIDHPLDPTNKYLNHSLVESPDMKTVYDGNATTNEKGEVTVQLPNWFEALNRDFRYQLTVVGDQFAQARVSSKIKDNHFTIKTDKPNIEVSWQVTGIRQDPYANAHRTPVEQGKPADEVGKYLHPEEYGQLTLSSPAPPTP